MKRQVQHSQDTSRARSRLLAQTANSGAPIRVGTAGWSIPRETAAFFSSPGSHLERYSRTITCAEINSSFHRPHRSSTYDRWAASTPEDFKFSVKVPKSITHQCSLSPSPEQFNTFLDAAGRLGKKLGPLLFQLPPRQDLEGSAARSFLSLFRNLYPSGLAALEPRHPAWFSPEASNLLEEFHIARVAADPPPTSEATRPAGYSGLVYYRLHGAPRIYYSSYSDAHLANLATQLAAKRHNGEVWCIFDNTASGAALGNVLTLATLLGSD